MNRTKAIQFWHQVEGFRGDHGRVLPDSAGLVDRHALLTRDTHHEPNLRPLTRSFHSPHRVTQPRQGRQVLAGEDALVHNSRAFPWKLVACKALYLWDGEVYLAKALGLVMACDSTQRDVM